MKLNDELTNSIASVTEAAAIAAMPWVGKQDKNAADAAAVAAMRERLNSLNINGQIVIGEGEIDEAPMLYIGEQVGNVQGEKIEIAVDPIDGTRMVATGENNSLAILAAGFEGSFLQAPDMYMEKLVVGKKAAGVIDLNHCLEYNLDAIAQTLDKSLNQLTLAILDKPRHHDIIIDLRNRGINVITLPDGDVLASLYATMPNNSIDVMYGIGGAPEGVISAAIAKALGGDMQARLITRDIAKGNTATNREIAAQEIARCHNMGTDVNITLPLETLVRHQDVMFAATAITTGDLLSGVTEQSDYLHTHSLVINGSTHSLRYIENYHLR
ncbi:class II fructose-bisphosphatase [Proteus mirabilis]|uniref:class II fructose-bisphosphatase n=1 Tax=Proteus mirabilis TaxID=584 RepID=UPI0039B38C75